jgi:hypothetical protein
MYQKAVSRRGLKRISGPGGDKWRAGTGGSWVRFRGFVYRLNLKQRSGLKTRRIVRPYNLSTHPEVTDFISIDTGIMLC